MLDKRCPPIHVSSILSEESPHYDAQTVIHADLSLEVWGTYRNRVGMPATL